MSVHLLAWSERFRWFVMARSCVHGGDGWPRRRLPRAHRGGVSDGCEACVIGVVALVRHRSLELCNF